MSEDMFQLRAKIADKRCPSDELKPQSTDAKEYSGISNKPVTWDQVTNFSQLSSSTFQFVAVAFGVTSVASLAASAQLWSYPYPRAMLVHLCLEALFAGLAIFIISRLILFVTPTLQPLAPAARYFMTATKTTTALGAIYFVYLFGECVKYSAAVYGCGLLPLASDPCSISLEQMRTDEQLKSLEYARAIRKEIKNVEEERNLFSPLRILRTPTKASHSIARNTP
jgi:hypothetical protein